MELTADELWRFLPGGYLATIAIEIPILLLGLSRGHSLRRRLIAGVWLTACTYPMVVLVLPLTVGRWGYIPYLIVAETFAPVAECLIFRTAYPVPKATRDALQDLATITVANLVSFGVGYWLYSR
jgi:hypothetical protein